MAIDQKTLEDLMQAHFPNATIEIQDLAGDGDHYAITVESDVFKGKPRVLQHKMVYEALKGEMGGALHALAVKTKIPNGTTS